jgi:putative endonuclease
MSDSKSLGQKGEDLAADHLKQKGYSIRHRNWVSGKNEIDIIAENKDTIVFVEVKTRSENPKVDPRDSITKDKRNSIIYTAENYIRRFNINKESRFDVILIEAEGDGFKIEHIEYAYYPTLR